MKRLLRRVVWTALAVLLVGLALSVAAAAWLDRKFADPRLAEQVGEQLSRRFGAEVRFEKLDVSWPGWVECHGVTLRLEDLATSPLLAEIAKVRLLVSLISLLTGRPEVTLIHLDSPAVTLHLTPGGKLALPGAFAGQAGPGRTKDSPADSAPRRLLLPNVERIEISGGGLRLIEADGSVSFTTRDLNLRGSVSFKPAGAIAEGRIKVGRIVLKNGAQLEHVSSAVTVSNAFICLSDLRGESEGARIQASATAFPIQGVQHFHLRARIEELNPAALGRFASIPSCIALDHANAEIAGGSALERPEELVATGSVTLHGARLLPNALLKSSGLDVAFPGWDEVGLGAARGSLLISNGWLRVSDFAAGHGEAACSGDLAFGPAGQSRSDLCGALPLAGGIVRCRFTHCGDTNAMPYTAAISLDGLNLPALLKPFDVKFRHGRRTLRLCDYVKGSLSGSFDAPGDFTRPHSTVSGAVSVADCTLAGLQLLDDMAVKVALPELRSLRFGTLDGKIVAADGALRVQNFRTSDRANSAAFETSFAIRPAGSFDGDIALRLPLWSGRAGAKLTLKTAGPQGQPFSLAIDAADIDTGALLKTFGGKPGTLAGRGSLRFQGTGNTRAPAQARGQGSVAVRPARIKGSPVLAVLGTLISMPRLDSVDLDSLETDFTLSDRTIQFSSIRTAPETRTHFTGRGSVNFDGALDMRGELVVNSGAAGFAANTLYSLGLKTTRGTFRVPFRLTGNARKPDVRLDTPNVPGSVTAGAIDTIPFVNRIPALFRKKDSTQPKQGDTGNR